MDIERRVIILTGEGSGSVTVTKVEGECKIKISLFSLPYKRYYLLIKENEVVEYEWVGAHAEILHNKNINCDLAHFIVSDGERALLYGTQNPRRLWQSNLPTRRKKIEKKSVEIAPPKTENFSYSEVPTVCACYDDGAIAQENYYERKIEDGKEESMSFSEEYRNYILSVSELACSPKQKTEIEEEQTEKEQEVFVHDDTLKIKQKMIKSGYDEAVFLVPTIEHEEKVVARGRKLTFYEEVKEQIDKLFESGERVKELEQNLPFTRWVKIDYERRHYVVGLVGTPPEYLCYGLPARYTVCQPEELGEGCWWLPKDVRLPMEDGYWVLYQSLVTGESVNKNPI